MLLISKALGTSISYLYGETDDPRPAARWHTEDAPSNAAEAALELVVADLGAMKDKVASLLRRAPEMTEAQAREVFETDAMGHPYEPPAPEIKKTAARKG